LPSGEKILWQGSPDFWEIAKSAFHIRKIALYFLLILVIQGISAFENGSANSGESLWASLSLTLMLSALGLGILATLAYLTARVTIYTVTNRRVLIRFGIALQMTVNLPVSQITAADMREAKNGFGDIPLTVREGQKVSYLVLWPNVRPWAFARPQPMLRSIANVRDVARVIADVAADLSNNTHGSAPTATKPSRSMSGAAVESVLMKSKAS
jgi:hypothetical protein